MKKTIFSIIFSLLVIGLQAQETRVISGSVKDNGGLPVYGAVVILQSARNTGVVTDADGQFSISVPSVNSILEIQCLGYKTRTIEIGNASRYEIVLSEDTEVLEKAVVIGYGSVRESDITGSVAQVKIDEQEASRVNSLDQMLQGRTAGVQIQATGGSPGAGMNIRIRGNSSFNGGGEPLYVVDGVIINSSNSNINVMSHASEIQEEETSGLLGINPQDIESMEILKDASATAIYGALGANGVILITTKSAGKERPEINFSAGVEYATRSRTIEMLDLDTYTQYLDAQHYTALNNTLYVNPDDRSQGYRVKGVNWQDEMMRDAISQRYNLSVGSKKKDTSYRLSLSYKDTQGILKNTDLQQLMTRLNMDRQINDRLKLGMKMSISHLNANMMQSAGSGSLTSATSAVRSMLNAKPYTDPDDPDDDAGSIENDDMGGRPDRWLRDFVNKRSETRIIPNLNLEYELAPWLTAKAVAGGDYRVRNYTKWKGPFVTFGTDWALSGLGTNQSMQYNIDAMLLFNKAITSHNISGTLGVSYFNAQGQSVIRQGWNIDQYYAQYDNINSAPITSTKFSYAESQSATLSYLARAIYSYRDRYVLTATFRCDGSSRFSKANRYAYFPSFAFAWRVNEEPWFDFDKISSLKLRLGWGRVGNQAVSSYQTLSNYSSTYYPDHSEGNEKKVIVGLVPANLANMDLRWETTEQVNAGVDLKLNRKRLNFSFDAYMKRTFDLLQEVEVPATTGFENMWMNLGVIRNQGIEFSFDAVAVKNGDFNLDFFGNISHNSNTIESIGIPSSDGNAPFFYGNNVGGGNYCKAPINIFREGWPVGIFYGLETDGIVQSGETGPGLTQGQLSLPGSIRYVDQNGDNVIDTEDRVRIGDPNPDFTYGFGASFSWKRLSMNLQFEGSYGNDIANINLIQEWDTSRQKYNIRREVFTDAWDPVKNPSGYYPALNTGDPNLGSYTFDENKFFSDRCVEDGSYLRLANVTVSYDVPLKKSAFIRSLNLAVNASNVFCLTSYSGWDPNVNIYGSDMMKMGADFGSYPQARTFSLDVKLSF